MVEYNIIINIKEIIDIKPVTLPKYVWYLSFFLKSKLKLKAYRSVKKNNFFEFDINLKIRNSKNFLLLIFYYFWNEIKIYLYSI